MPLYQFRNSEGRVIEETRAIADRDICPPGYQRITVPVHIGWVGCRENPHTVDAKTKHSLRDMEIKYGSERVARESGYSVAALKHHWLESPSIAAASGDNE